MSADRNLCLGDLIGVIRPFFHKIGITQVCVRIIVDGSHVVVAVRKTCPEGTHLIRSSGR